MQVGRPGRLPDYRLPGLESHLGDDGHQHFAECLEVLFGLPDPVDREVSVSPGHGMVDHALGLTAASDLVDTAIGLAELPDGMCVLILAEQRPQRR